MPHLALANLVLEVADVERSVAFWTQALGYRDATRLPNGAVLAHPTDKRRPLLGVQKGTPPSGPHTSHFDLETDDRAAEVARLVKLGASVVEGWEYPMPNPNWTVMRDPDGHVFCVSQRPAERRLYG